MASALPTPPEQASVPYAKCRAELKGLTEGEITKLVLDSAAWDEVMRPILSGLDAARGKSGPKPAYNSAELESALLFQRICGYRAYGEARDALAGDRHGDARRLLGFDRPRATPGCVVQLLKAGVPSGSTVSRHLTRFGERRRRGAYERLFKRLVQEHLKDPEMRVEALIMALDGKVLRTHYTAPKIDPATGEVVNSRSVTCPEAGFLPPSAGVDKWGHGWNIPNILTSTGLPLAYAVTRINESEKDAALRLIRGEYARDVAPHMDREQLAVLTADGAFHKPELRAELRLNGIVENIHLASHADRGESKANAAKLRRRRYAIEGYPNWQANGHRQLVCDCGQGRTDRRFELTSGRAVVRLEGRCETCGSITITSGQWRRAQNPGRFVRTMPGETPDLTFGNPLTFDDPLAEAYGEDRFGSQEGFHGHACTTRFQLTKHQRWFRRADQAKTDVALVFSVLHVIAMEQRRRARAAAAQATGPPGKAAA